MKKLNSKGFGVIEGLLILVIVGLIGGIGFYVYKQQVDTKNNSDSNKNSKTVEPSQETEEILNSQIELEEVTEPEAKRIQEVSKSLYSLVLENQKTDKLCEGYINSYCPQYDSFITETAKKQLRTPEQYAQTICGQVKVKRIKIKVPVVEKSSASLSLEMQQVGAPQSNTYLMGLKLLKETGDWKIDKFDCKF